MKNKKTYFKQITALTLAAVMTCSATSFRSMAADQQVSDNSTVQATVTAQIASSWISSIPNTIEIDAGGQKGIMRLVQLEIFLETAIFLSIQTALLSYLRQEKTTLPQM